MREAGVGVALYARAHHVLGYAIGLAVLGLVDVLVGSRQIALPMSGASIAFVREIPSAYAALAVGTFATAMADFERSAAQRAARVRLAHLALAIVATTVVQGVVELAAESSGSAIIAMRSVLIWQGLALISARLMGETLCWVLPLASILPLTYFQQASDGSNRWWAWPSQSSTSLACWLLAAASLTIGISAFQSDLWNTPRLRIGGAARQRRSLRKELQP